MCIRDRYITITHSRFQVSSYFKRIRSETELVVQLTNGYVELSNWWIMESPIPLPIGPNSLNNYCVLLNLCISRRLETQKFLLLSVGFENQRPPACEAVTRPNIHRGVQKFIGIFHHSRYLLVFFWLWMTPVFFFFYDDDEILTVGKCSSILAHLGRCLVWWRPRTQEVTGSNPTERSRNFCALSPSGCSKLIIGCTKKLWFNLIFLFYQYRPA